MFTVLFACVHNAGRSQMAAALFNALVAPRDARAVSAGTEPAAGVHPVVVTVMQEVGIDLSAARPMLLTFHETSAADLLVTMGCGESCPVIPGRRREDWPVDDPAGKSVDEVRAIRDAISVRIQELLAREGLR